MTSRTRTRAVIGGVFAVLGVAVALPVLAELSAREIATGLVMAALTVAAFLAAGLPGARYRHWWPARVEPHRERFPRLRRVVLMIADLAVLALTAIDALVTAVLGVAPLTRKVRKAKHWIADRYRMAGSDVVDAEVIGEEFTPKGGR